MKDTIISVSAPHYVSRENCTDLEPLPGYYVVVEYWDGDETFNGPYSTREHALEFSDSTMVEMGRQSHYSHADRADREYDAWRHRKMEG